LINKRLATPALHGVYFTNILQTAFYPIVFCVLSLYLKFGFAIFCRKKIGAKAARKLLAKLAKALHVGCSFHYRSNVRVDL